MSRVSSSGSLRSVPGFTWEAYQKNTKVIEPPHSDVYQERKIKPTLFRRMYERGMFPMKVKWASDNRLRIKWEINLEEFDYKYYLPLYFDGLCDLMHPYEVMALKSIKELLQSGRRKIVPVIPYLIQPLKRALKTRHRRIVCNTLKILQWLIQCHPQIGPTLVPYYRQLLPPLSLYKHLNSNIGDDIDYSQHKRENIGDLVEQTLQMLEISGGKKAFPLIRKIIPTYQSCL